MTLIETIIAVVIIAVLSAVAIVGVRSAVDNARKSKVKAAATQFSRSYTAALNSGSTSAQSMNESVKGITGGAVTSLTTTAITSGGGLDLSTDNATTPTQVAISASGWCSQYTLPTAASGLGTLTLAAASTPIRANPLGSGSCTEAAPTTGGGAITAPAAGAAPISSFFSRAGGTGPTSAWWFDADASGNTFVTGVFTGTAAFGTQPLLNATPAGAQSLFVGKTNTNGEWQWAVSPTSTGTSSGYTVKATPDGGAIVVGSYTGSLTFGGTVLTSAGGSDVFVAKIGANGTWAWATSVGGGGGETPAALAVRTDGTVAVALTVPAGATFTFGTSYTSSAYNSVAVAQLNASGVAQNVAGIKGNTANTASGYNNVGLLADGTIIVATNSAGTVNAVNANGATAGTYGTASTRGIYISALNTAGTWTSTAALSGPSATLLNATGVAVNSDNSIWVGGQLSGSLSIGASNLSAGGTQTWVGKLSAAGGSWVSGNATGVANYAIYPDASDGGLLAVGSSASTVTFGSQTYTGTGARGFVAKMKPDQTWGWVSGISASTGSSIYTAERVGNSVLIGGQFQGTVAYDYPVNTTINSSPSNSEALISRITPP